MKRINTNKAFRFAYDYFKSHFWFIASIGIIIGAIYTTIEESYYQLLLIRSNCNIFTTDQDIAMCLRAFFRQAATSGDFFALIFWLIILYLASVWGYYAIINIALKVRDTRHANYEDLFSFIPKLFPLIVASIISTIFICLGLLAFILPGIYIAFRLMFAPLIVLDKNVAGWQAITKSFRLTPGHGGEIFELIIKIILISLPILLFTKLFVINPWISQGIQWLFSTFVAFVMVDAYRQISPKRK